MANRRAKLANVAVARDSTLGAIERNEAVMLERLVRLEERQTTHIEATKANFDATLATLSEQNRRIQELTAALNRYKGFWGAVTLLGSAIATAVIMLKEFLFGRMN